MRKLIITLIATLTILSVYAQPFTHSGYVYGANGQGLQNTINIDASTSSTPAATACLNYTLNGYDDWFLASQWELREMLKNSRIINETALENNGNKFKEPISGVTGEWYWSSTSGRIENIQLKGDIQYTAFGPEDRSRKHNVRAIRAF